MIRWGIIGAGKIAHRFVEGLAHEKNSCLSAVSCRTYEKAKIFADQYGCPVAYGSFDSIVNDSEIDAVYVAVPHAFHKEWVIRCLRSGKAVLSEKPLALSSEDVKDIMEVQKETGILCMEAMKTRFVPMYEEIMQIIEEGTIGDVKEVYTSFCSQTDMSDTKGYYMQPVGGGALLDVGIYCSSWIAAVCKDIPELRWLRADVRNGVDIYTDAVLGDDSVIYHLECALDRKKDRTMIIKGTKGMIAVPQFHRPVSAEVRSSNEHCFTVEKPYEYDDMYSEIHHFVQLLAEKKVQSDIMPLSESLRCAEILDTVRKGYTCNEETLQYLLHQEKDLDFSSFDYTDAKRLADIILDLQKSYDRTVSVSIFDEIEKTEIVRVLQNGKTERNLLYMNGKRNCALKCGHSSLYGAVENSLKEHSEQSDLNCCYTGGAFPIRVKGEWKFTVSVSGLHEGKDHELIIRALSIMKRIPVSDFPYRMI